MSGTRVDEHDDLMVLRLVSVSTSAVADAVSAVQRRDALWRVRRARTDGGDMSRRGTVVAGRRCSSSGIVSSGSDHVFKCKEENEG